MTTEDDSASSNFVSNLALRVKAKFKPVNQKRRNVKSKAPEEGRSENLATRGKGEHQPQDTKKSEIQRRQSQEDAKSRNSSGVLESNSAVKPTLFTPKADTHDIREKAKKWYDDVELERSTELSALHLHVSDITIKLPENSPENEELKTLVNYANDPPATVEDRKRSIEMLQTCLSDRKQREDDKVLEADQKQKGKQSQCGAFSTRLHGIIDSLTPQVTKVFEFVLIVLQGGVQVLQATAFLASEITFQTHYEVAIKAIMLFVTAYEKSRELTDDVVSMFDSIGMYGQEMETLQDVIRSASMSRAINRLFVSSVTLIVSAGSYMNHGTLCKYKDYLHMICTD
ncbi:hypothetical protein BKA67DRAFT_46966 [Truncatella angustata]|uniref:Uncharacterized protein n=1 Tax=Truncatella angustata TaxID=152316 RepID=A0A9P9A242_9PEZI|nr:uncharacterized protein BKA67DRAFT_46966 [Truncatella angustata]KAH6660286.1 hypothetical protein BKA67DRAFT_46966 [Truncatella angustata]